MSSRNDEPRWDEMVALCVVGDDTIARWVGYREDARMLCVHPERWREVSGDDPSARLVVCEIIQRVPPIYGDPMVGLAPALERESVRSNGAIGGDREGWRTVIAAGAFGEGLEDDPDFHQSWMDDLDDESLQSAWAMDSEDAVGIEVDSREMTLPDPIEAEVEVERAACRAANSRIDVDDTEPAEGDYFYGNRPGASSFDDDDPV